MKNYNAPWSKLLVGISLLATAVCLGITVVIAQQMNGPVRWTACVPILVMLFCALFTIRGYTVTPDKILVRRLLWSTPLPRRGLQTARFEPNAMRASVRTWGNGGLFSFSGFYWNKALGAYRAYVTDTNRTVVLRYATARTVLLSPAAPEEFIHDLRSPTPAVREPARSF